MRRAKYLLLLLIPAAVAAAWAAGLFAPRPTGDAPPLSGGPRFEDVATRAGIWFQHFDPATPQHLMPETMGSGVAWIDYNADGWPDLFFVQDGPMPSYLAPGSPNNALYRNTRDGKFAYVNTDGGQNQTGFWTGVAVGDYDNDGFDDLLLTGLNRIALLHNEPDGADGRKFVDVTAKAGLANPHYGTSCAWGDLDGDGFLDLYVCNYVEFDPAAPVTCKHEGTGTAIQCAPTAFPLAAHKLYRNNRDGTFADVTKESGIGAAPLAPGLAVTILDLDGDGKQDVFVANDLHPAYLFRNRGGWRFDEVALVSGCGLGVGGARMAGMCAEAADVDGSGRPSLFVTNFQDSPNTLFLNRGLDPRGNLRFSDATNSSGLGPPSLVRLGFGAVFFDADLDGNADLAVANGHVQRPAKELYGVPYAQAAQLFLGDGRGKFRDASAGAGADFLKPRVGRGLARCDFDNDGKPDVAMSGVGEAAAVLRNATDTAHAWVNLELVGDGKASNRNAIGAVVRVEWGGLVRTHFVAGGGSYLSASDRRLSLGLGPDVAKLDKVTVRWPSGRTQEYRDLAARAFWRLREGVEAPEKVR